jgi:hypothetical protein
MKNLIPLALLLAVSLVGCDREKEIAGEGEYCLYVLDLKTVDADSGEPVEASLVVPAAEQEGMSGVAVPLVIEHRPMGVKRLTWVMAKNVIFAPSLSAAGYRKTTIPLQEAIEVAPGTQLSTSRESDEVLIKMEKLNNEMHGTPVQHP